MSELKPVAWSLEYNGTHVTADKSLAMSLKADGVAVTPLYAIPDGYALVPEGAIRKLCNGFDNAIRNASDDYDKGYLREMKNYIAEYLVQSADAQFPKGSVVDEEV